MAFLKHRQEKDIWEISFEERLNSTETLLLDGLEVEIERALINLWENATSEFPLATGLRDGKIVQITLSEAPTPDDQRAGIYRLIVHVSTSEDRRLVGIADLRVIG